MYTLIGTTKFDTKNDFKHDQAIQPSNNIYHSPHWVEGISQCDQLLACILFCFHWLSERALIN